MSKKLQTKDFERLAFSRNHLVIDASNYKNVKSPLILYCNECLVQWQTSAHSYKACKNGCPSCKKKITSKTHKNKKVSEETRRLIGEKASHRKGSLVGIFGENHPAWKGGYGRDFKTPSTEDYNWKNNVKKRCNLQCIVTGVKESNKIRMVCHHLNGWSHYPENRYDPENGVYITREIHKQFHDIYGYGKNTELQFQEFLKQSHNLDLKIIKEQLKTGNHQPSLSIDREEGSETKQ